MAWRALKAIPGQRSATFEIDFNQAITNTSIRHSSAASRPNNGFDFSKYTGDGKYASLVGNA